MSLLLIVKKPKYNGKHNVHERKKDETKCFAE